MFVTSDLERLILQNMVKRRQTYRKQFLMLKSDPEAHSKESGYIFDPALQRFISMKSCQYDNFQPNKKNFWLLSSIVVLPMLLYGYCIYQSRAKIEHDIRCGKLRYKDRMNKLI